MPAFLFCSLAVAAVPRHVLCRKIGYIWGVYTAPEHRRQVRGASALPEILVEILRRVCSA